ncbi:hypothetical protein [Erythrobacter sp. SG61-1L]|uniref:hypothetical protein n=1 Tax=Erythrobacter sp. SG61-1L TaxID=1603897 RepID=UPI0012E121AD|nr:hypothetical protein [Erythrobacter sp. SG61-1L]
MTIAAPKTRVSAHAAEALVYNIQGRSMVRKNRSQLPDSPFALAESVLANEIGQALRDELGASRRATKTIMRWTGVSDTTARAWLQGRVSPSGLHLLQLAAKSASVMVVVLQLTGHRDLEISFRLQEIEADLDDVVARIRVLTGPKT